ncbi:MAG: hypothetical protein KF729_30150 [Sandaracinaceae bacterium]|nr:hypothetical protein [Sandaracinaceae bacterium]
MPVTTRSILFALALAAVPSLALAQAPDRVAFGHDVRVGAHELVGDAVSFGGDTVVDGVVEGDAVAFGGSVILRGGADVRGDAVAFGGQVRDERAADGAVGPAAPVIVPAREPGFFEGLWAFLGETARSAVLHALLFLLGLLMIGAGRERLRVLQAAMVEDGVKTAGAGLVGYVAAIAAIVLFALTVIGIPAAIVVGLALPLATYVGLAAAATVLGAALPIPQLRGKEIHQLAAGVAVLFLASLVPVAGGIFTAAVACLGLGALLRTRLATTPHETATPAGPYRTPAAL